MIWRNQDALWKHEVIGYSDPMHLDNSQLLTSQFCFGTFKERICHFCVEVYPKILR